MLVWNLSLRCEFEQATLAERGSYLDEEKPCITSLGSRSSGISWTNCARKRMVGGPQKQACPGLRQADHRAHHRDRAGPRWFAYSPTTESRMNKSLPRMAVQAAHSDVKGATFPNPPVGTFGCGVAMRHS
jgi:hypothetical protein